MKQGLILLLPAALFFACKAKEKDAEQAGAFFPVHSYLQSQIKHIDTSLYNLRRIEKRGNKSDTTIIPREQFRTEAADFLTVEDIASPKWNGDYIESRMYDDVLKRAVFSYTPKEEGTPLLRQDVTIEPGTGGDDAVKTIFINKLEEKGDSSVQKKMFWEVGRRFQVTTSVSRSGAPDENRTLEVWWGPFPSAE